MTHSSLHKESKFWTSHSPLNLKCYPNWSVKVKETNTTMIKGGQKSYISKELRITPTNYTLEDEYRHIFYIWSIRITTTFAHTETHTHTNADKLTREITFLEVKIKNKCWLLIIVKYFIFWSVNGGLYYNVQRRQQVKWVILKILIHSLWTRWRKFQLNWTCDRWWQWNLVTVIQLHFQLVILHLNTYTSVTTHRINNEMSA